MKNSKLRLICGGSSDPRLFFQGDSSPPRSSDNPGTPGFVGRNQKKPADTKPEPKAIDPAEQEMQELRRAIEEKEQEIERIRALQEPAK